jgi:AmiR/NasT family two-component response regulator
MTVTANAGSAQLASGEAGEMIETLQALLAIERERADALKEAVRVARRMGIAVGLVMARRGISADQAFALLHAASDGVHHRLQDIVEGVIAERLTL